MASRRRYPQEAYPGMPSEASPTPGYGSAPQFGTPFQPAGLTNTPTNPLGYGAPTGQPLGGSSAAPTLTQPVNTAAYQSPAWQHPQVGAPQFSNPAPLSQTHAQSPASPFGVHPLQTTPTSSSLPTPPHSGQPGAPPVTAGPPLVNPYSLETQNPYASGPYGFQTSDTYQSGIQQGPPAAGSGTITTRRTYPVPDYDAEGGSSYSDVSEATQMMGSMNLQQGAPPMGGMAAPVGGGYQQPGAIQAGTNQPGMMQPGMMQPGMMQPGMAQPGAVAPGPYSQQPAAHPVAHQEDASYKPDAEAQCPPEYMRMTINAIPSSAALMQKSCIPLGCVLHPMAPLGEIPVVNFGRTGIIRCRKCRAYINPFVQFVEGGRRWKCNICDLANEVPNEYFCELDRNGRRKDLAERLELSRGCVEFVAPSEYMVRRPMPPTYFFVVDVSYYSVTSGMLKAFADTIKNVLDKLPDTERTNIGFITFDSTIHFYNLKSSLSQPRMLVVSDIEDVFLPLPDDLLVNLKESRDVVNALIARLPSMHQHTQNVESALGPALKAAWNVMRSVGGKMMIFVSKLPSVGFAALKNREDTKLLGTDKEVNLLRPEHQFYKEFALDCSRQQISVDTFLFSPHYTDVATLSVMSQFTGGQCQYYPAFSIAKDGEKFSADLTRVLTRETGWEAVMRLRASQGVRVSAHYGNFYIRSTDLMALPNIDADKAFAVQLQVEQVKDPLNDRRYLSVQNALLYTTSLGERRIRVFTICLPVTSSLADLFKLADVDAVVTVMSKMAIEKALQTKLSDARQAILHKCIDILSVYRQSFASPNTSPTQLVLPESLKLLPLYTLALIKHVAFRSGADIRPDERAFYMAMLRILSAPLSISLIYPRLYQLNNMPQQCGTVAEDGRVVLPAVNNLSSEKLDQTGVFLLDDGQYLLLWLAKNSSPEVVQQLFGVPTLLAVDETQLQLVDLGNDLSSRVCNIVNSIRSQHPLYQKLYIIREGEPMEYRFFGHFVEDHSKTLPSYYEFLCQLQRQVQNRAK